MTADEARIMKEQAVASRELREAFDRYVTIAGSTVTQCADAFAAYDAAFARVEALRAELATARGQAPC
jgi:hypothetical protein